MPEFSRRQLLVWAVVGIVIAVIGGRYLWSEWARQESAAVGVPAATVGLKREEPSVIKVHVVGAVALPGLYDLPAGSRAAEAIEAAGGPLPSADLARVNLAAKVADGQQLVVAEAGQGVGGPSAGAGGSAAGGVASGPINLNSATLDELTMLDGIGPKTAQKIIDYREQHGGFSHVEELMEVPGIGPAKFDQIKDQVVV